MGANRGNVVRELVFENNKLNHALILMAETILGNISCQCRFCGFNKIECEDGECVDGIVKYYKSKSGIKKETK